MPSSLLNRAFLRHQVMHWTDAQRRVAVERVLEALPDALLLRILKGLVYFDEPESEGASPAPSLSERVTAHVEATRRGAFLGDYILRNKHGQREPWQTSARVAATWHLFDLALQRAPDADEEALSPLRALVDLVAEVDERTDQLVVFEDDNAAFVLDHEVKSAKLVLSSGPPVDRARA